MWALLQETMDLIEIMVDHSLILTHIVSERFYMNNKEP